MDELFIGTITDIEEQKGVIYDVYAMVDGEPAHVVSGGERDRYYITDSYFLCNETSSGAELSAWDIYGMMSNSTELVQQISFLYDGYTDAQNPYFVSYGEDEEPESVEQADWEERRNAFTSCERFDYTPLRNVAE